FPPLPPDCELSSHHRDRETTSHAPAADPSRGPRRRVSRCMESAGNAAPCFSQIGSIAELFISKPAGHWIRAEATAPEPNPPASTAMRLERRGSAKDCRFKRYRAHGPPTTLPPGILGENTRDGTRIA